MINLATVLTFGGLALSCIGSMMGDKAKEINQDKIIDQKIEKALAKKDEDEES